MRSTDFSSIVGIKMNKTKGGKSNDDSKFKNSTKTKQGHGYRLGGKVSVKKSSKKATPNAVDDDE